MQSTGKVKMQVILPGKPPLTHLPQGSSRPLRAPQTLHITHICCFPGDAAVLLLVCLPDYCVLLFHAESMFYLSLYSQCQGHSWLSVNIAFEYQLVRTQIIPGHNLLNMWCLINALVKCGTQELVDPLLLTERNLKCVII